MEIHRSLRSIIHLLQPDDDKFFYQSMDFEYKNRWIKKLLLFCNINM